MYNIRGKIATKSDDMTCASGDVASGDVASGDVAPGYATCIYM